MSVIKHIEAREILDSRGIPTIEVEIYLTDNKFSRVAVPSGTSVGKYEAMELRDSSLRYNGKGVEKAIQTIKNEIAPVIKGLAINDQRLIDQTLLDLDGTPNKSRLGANTVTGISLAVAKAAAESASLPLFKYLGGPNAHILPVPMMNIFNGGLHANTEVDVQEFMIVPIGSASFKESLQWGTEVYHSLKYIIKKHGLSTGLGDEGGFAAEVKTTKETLDLIVSAIEIAGFKLGSDIAISLDVAANRFYVKESSYFFENKIFNLEEMIKFYACLIDNYPLVSIEDPFSEDDWNSWVKLTSNFGDKLQIVGDDLFVTNPERLEDGIERGAANAMVVKVNQIGTLTETLDAVALAHNNGYRTIVSHRSGDTEDVIIADLAVALGSGQIKTGAPARSERVAKYNQLLRIEEKLGDSARYAADLAFPRFEAK